MKQTVYLTILFTLFAILSLSAKEFQNGKLVLISGKIIECKIEVHEINKFVTSAKTKYKIGEELLKIPTDKIKELHLDSLKYERIHYTYTKTVQRGPRKATVKQTDNFLSLVVQEGSAKLYKYYYVKQNYTNVNGVLIPTTSYLAINYYIKRNENYFIVNYLSFKKDCMKIYKDCPIIISKLKAKEYKYDQIVELVELSNSICTSD